MTTPEDKIIEAVARAICSLDGSDPDYEHTVFGEPVGQLWEINIPEAKAAIQAYEQAKGE